MYGLYRYVLLYFLFWQCRMLSDGADVEELGPLAEEFATDKDEEKATQHVLWVEKYTPKYFTELLSDDVSTKM